MEIHINTWTDFFVLCGLAYFASTLPAVWIAGFVWQGLKDNEDQERAGWLVSRLFLYAWILLGSAMVFGEMCL